MTNEKDITNKEYQIYKDNFIEFLTLMIQKYCTQSLTRKTKAN